MKTYSPELTITEALPSLALGSVAAAIALDTCLEPGLKTEGLFSVFEAGPDLLLPTNYVDKEPRSVVVPSLQVESLRGHRALVVDLAPTNDDLSKLYQAACKSRPRATERIDDMTFESLVRILDTPGDNGLHHIHGTQFPRTVYHNVRYSRRGGSSGGMGLGIYLSEVGRFDDKPVYARITATDSKKSEYNFFRVVGAGNQKARYNP